MTLPLGNYFPIHAHSRYSILDGMGSVWSHVARAAELRHPAFALTDHGTMAGTVELYRAARRFGVTPLPGIEAYAAYGDHQRKTFHVGLVALSTRGYLNLVAINNQMMADFYYKPILDLTRLDRFDTTDVILTTGCHFGVALSAHRADPVAALNVVAALSGYFDVFVEAQSHGIVTDEQDDVDAQYAALSIADTLGLPMVLGSDAHYVTADRRAMHDTMKRLGSWSDDPDSAVFPGEYGYHLVDARTAQAQFEPRVFARGLEGLGEVLDLCRDRMSIPPLDTFAPILVEADDTDLRLEIRCREALLIKMGVSGRSWNIPITADDHDRYVDRLTDELAVIAEFGFSGYMLLVAEITDYLRRVGIMFNIRGSGVGSLVVHLLGICALDPLQWDLGFERFLSRNRMKMPDIDIDVDSSRRDEVISHLRRTYVVRSIANYGEMGIVEEAGIYKGSALQRWKTEQRKRGASQVPDAAVFAMLRDMCGSGDVIGTRGTHASGLVVAPDDRAMRWMPMNRVASGGSERLVTALDMNSVEALGYIKVDVLGLKALHAVSHAMTLIGMDDLDQIPLDDAKVYAVLSSGSTEGMFQLEGWTARKGLRVLKPTSIDDVIAAMALFRPAAMDSGATDRYLRRRTRIRSGAPVRDPALGLHPDISTVISATLGELLFQEQVIDILKNLGMSPEELSDALKVVKASNSKVADARVEVTRLLKRVDALGRARGWTTKDIDWMDVAFEAYANYGFNRAHATSYGLLAYRTAWLVYHYPGEFWAGMITAHASDDEKVAEYTKALAGRGFTRMPVDINHSGVAITVDTENKRVYPALTTIKGVGVATAKAIVTNGPYIDLDDLIHKLSTTRISGVQDLIAGKPPRQCTGVIGLLAKAGALRSLT